MTLDMQRLGEWMDTQGMPSGPIIDVEALGGGTQNIVLRFARGGRSYVIRHPPLYKRSSSDETMRREARVLAALRDTEVPHPALVAACCDLDVLGSAFYLMEPVNGSNPTVDLPTRYTTDRSWRYKLGLAMVDGAAAVGAVDYVALGLTDLGRAEGFLERQVTRWRSQLDSYSQLPNYRRPDIPGVDEVATWLEINRPTRWRPGLIHGDYQLSNVICKRDRPALAAIVDWELTTIGDPLLDIGWLLATWPGPDGLTAGTIGIEPWDGFPTAETLTLRYSERSDRDLSSLSWYVVLACYKLGIILEGTYARALNGQAPMDVGEQLHANTLGLFARARHAISRS